MAKKIKLISKNTLELALRTGIGFGAIAAGTSFAGEIGSVIGGYIASNYIVQGDFEKKFVWWISILNAFDLFFERFAGNRGVIG